MRKFLLPLAMLGSLLAVPAHAQATRTWVSGVGDDVNPCSRTAPCKTFAGAISKTARNGEINCLDPGGFGAVTITKSITIDCHEVFASILHSGTTGVIINFNSFDPALDLRKTVRLRNINFNAADTGINGIRIIGAAASTGSEVFIEDCLIEGNFAGNGRGISDERTGGGELSISNTTVRNNSGLGIVILGGTGTGAQRSKVTVDNVLVQNSDFGIAISNASVSSTARFLPATLRPESRPSRPPRSSSPIRSAATTASASKRAPARPSFGWRTATSR